MLYRILADLVVTMHFLFVVFMVVGITLTVWHWGRRRLFGYGGAEADRFFNRWSFRTLHLVGIAYVGIQAILEKYCPLTVLENYLRSSYDPDATYPGSCIIHYLELLVYPRIHPAAILIPTFAGAVVTVVVYILHPPEKITAFLYRRREKD